MANTTEDHHPEPESYSSLRTKALESVLIEKGLVSSDVIDGVVNAYERDIGPLNGAKVVARAWSNPEYRRRLLDNGTDAISELGFKATQGAGGSNIVVLENTPTVHNVVVCTLCSCYPWPGSWPSTELVQVPRIQVQNGHRAEVCAE